MEQYRSVLSKMVCLIKHAPGWRNVEIDFKPQGQHRAGCDSSKVEEVVQLYQYLRLDTFHITGVHLTETMKDVVKRVTSGGPVVDLEHMAGSLWQYVQACAMGEMSDNGERPMMTAIQENSSKCYRARDVGDEKGFLSAREKVLESIAQLVLDRQRKVYQFDPENLVTRPKLAPGAL